MYTPSYATPPKRPIWKPKVPDYLKGPGNPSFAPVDDIFSNGDTSDVTGRDTRLGPGDPGYKDPTPYAGTIPGTTPSGVGPAGVPAGAPPHDAFSDNPKPPIFGTPGTDDIFGAGWSNASAGYGYQPNFKPTPENPAITGDIEAAVRDLLKNNSAFTPEVMDAMKAQLHSATEGKLAANVDALQRDASSRGLGRTSYEASKVAAARNQSASDYGAGVQDMYVQKAKQEFADKVAALDRGQKYLDQYRQWVLALDASDTEKERSKAELSLAYTKISQEREALMAQIKAQFGLAAFGANANAQLAEYQNAPREGRDYVTVRIPDPNAPSGYRDVKVPIAALSSLPSSAQII